MTSCLEAPPFTGGVNRRAKRPCRPPHMVRPQDAKYRAKRALIDRALRWRCVRHTTELLACQFPLGAVRKVGC